MSLKNHMDRTYTFSFISFPECPTCLTQSMTLLMVRTTNLQALLLAGWQCTKSKSLLGNNNFTVMLFHAKPSLKIRTVSAIFLLYLGIFRDYGLKNIFLGIKLKIESWNIQHLFEKKICEISQNFNSIRQSIYNMEISWMSWNFVRLKNKKVLFLKTIF